MLSSSYERRAGDELGERQGYEAEHREPAVPHLRVGGHHPSRPRLGGHPLEQRHKRRRRQHRRRRHKPLQPRAVGQLRGQPSAPGQLDSQCRHEPHHGQSPVDSLRRRTRERQHVGEPGACLRRDSRRGGGRGRRGRRGWGRLRGRQRLLRLRRLILLQTSKKPKQISDNSTGNAATEGERGTLKVSTLGNEKSSPLPGNGRGRRRPGG